MTQRSRTSARAAAVSFGAYFVLVKHSSVLSFIAPFFIFPVPAWVFLGVYFVYQLVIGGASSPSTPRGRRWRSLLHTSAGSRSGSDRQGVRHGSPASPGRRIDGSRSTSSGPASRADDLRRGDVRQYASSSRTRTLGSPTSLASTPASRSPTEAESYAGGTARQDRDLPRPARGGVRRRSGSSRRRSASPSSTRSHHFGIGRSASTSSAGANRRPSRGQRRADVERDRVERPLLGERVDLHRVAERRRDPPRVLRGGEGETVREKRRQRRPGGETAPVVEPEHGAQRRRSGSGLPAIARRPVTYRGSTGPDARRAGRPRRSPAGGRRSRRRRAPPADPRRARRGPRRLRDLAAARRPADTA